MRCASARNRFDALFDDRLDAGARRRVEEHLAGCAACARSYETMRRILQGVRRLPRPGAPHLEVSPPAGLLPASGAIPVVRRRRSLRAVAAAALFLGLVVTHVIAFRLGDGHNRELAAIARENLARLADDHFDRTASQLRVAHALAEEDPSAARRLALQDPVAEELRRRSRALLTVSHEPGLRVIQEGLARFVRRQDEVFAATDVESVRREIPRLQEDLNELSRILQQRAGSVARPEMPRTAEDAIRTGMRLLAADRPADAGRSVAGYILNHRDSSYAHGQLRILWESSIQVGEVRELEAMQRLIRATGPAGLRVFVEESGGLAGAGEGGGARTATQMITIRIGPQGRPVAVPARIEGPFAEWADFMRSLPRGARSPVR